MTDETPTEWMRAELQAQLWGRRVKPCHWRGLMTAVRYYVGRGAKVSELEDVLRMHYPLHYPGGGCAIETAIRLLTTERTPGPTRSWTHDELNSAHPLSDGWAWGWTSRDESCGWFAYASRADNRTSCSVWVDGDGQVHIDCEDEASRSAPDEVVRAVSLVRHDVRADFEGDPS